MRKAFLSMWFGGIIIIIFTSAAFSQEKIEQRIQVPKDNYLIGEEENLEIIVHIWGEVRNPGEKRVPDGTNILELISKAGGPTEFSNFSKILLYSKPTQSQSLEDESYPKNGQHKFIFRDLEELRKTGKVEIDITQYLKNGSAPSLPKLIPGDVVYVKRNVWHKWQTFIRVASQIALIAQVWYWYSRID